MDDARQDAKKMRRRFERSIQQLVQLDAGAHGSSSGPPFARAVAFYRGCGRPERNGWRDGVLLQILVGAADDWTGPEACQSLTASAHARGEPVEITIYPGAYTTSITRTCQCASDAAWRTL